MSRNGSIALLFASLLLSCSVFHGAEPLIGAEAPPKLLAYAERSNELRYVARATAQKEISAARAKVSEAKRQRFPTPDAKRKAIESAQAKLERATEKLDRIDDPFEPYYAPIAPKTLKVGSIGRIDWKESSVYQVVDRYNMLVEFSWPVLVTKLLDSSAAATEGNVYERTEYKSTLIWVEGINTSKLVDKKALTCQEVNPKDVFEVVRSKTYGTAAGSLSVPMLELKDMAPYTHLFNRSDQVRTWKDATGRHSFEAIFVKYERGKVRLMSLERKATELKLEELCEADQEYVRDQMHAERRAVMSLR